MDAAGESSTATVVLVVSANAGGAWPTFGNGPEHAGFAPLNHPTGPWALQWSSPLNVALNQVAMAGGLVFVTPYELPSPNIWCRALDAATGAQRWILNGADANNFADAPTWHDGHPYVQRGRISGGSSAI